MMNSLFATLNLTDSDFLPVVSEQDQQAANALSDDYHFGPVLKPGVYEANGNVYVVKPNQQKTRLYAKQWKGSHLEYVSGAIYTLHPVNKVTRERGEALSVAFGACCVCGRLLTDPKSVKKGIGPICGKMFL